MTPYDAESLNHFIETGERHTVPPSLAESAEAVAAHAQSIVPDPQFMSLLEKRLMDNYHPHPTPTRKGWWATLLSPVGRLAWGIAVVLVGIGLAMTLRGFAEQSGEVGNSSSLLPASCQLSGEFHDVFISPEGNFCFTYPSVILLQAGNTIVLQFGLSDPEMGDAKIVIHYEAAQGRTTQEYFEATIAQRSGDASWWEVSYIPFAQGTAILRTPKMNHVSEINELFAVVGENIYHLSYLPSPTFNDWDRRVWKHLQVSFAILPQALQTKLAACPAATDGGVLVGLHGFCFRYPNRVTSKLNDEALDIPLRQSNSDRSVIMAQPAGGDLPLAVFSVLSSPDNHLPLEQYLTSDTITEGLPYQILGQERLTLGGVEAMRGTIVQQDGSTPPLYPIVVRANGRIYYLISVTHTLSNFEEDTLPQILNSFTLIPPLVPMDNAIDQPPLPVTRPPVTATHAPMPTLASPTPYSVATVTPPTATFVPTPSPEAMIEPTVTPTSVPSNPAAYPITELVRAPSLVVDGWSPDGKWVAYWEISEALGMSSRGQMVLSDRTGTTLCTPAGATTDRDNIFAPKPWLPDGRFVYQGADGSLRLLSQPCGEPTIIAPADSWLTVLASSVDGQQMLLMGQERLWLWHDGDAEPWPVGESAMTIFPGAAFSPDGRWIALSSGPAPDDGTIKVAIINTNDGLVIQEVMVAQTENTGAAHNGPAASPLWLDASRLIIPWGTLLPIIVDLNNPTAQLPSDLPILNTMTYGVERNDTHLLLWSRDFDGSYMISVSPLDRQSDEPMIGLPAGNAMRRFVLAPQGGDFLIIEESPSGESSVMLRRAGVEEPVLGPAVIAPVEVAWSPDATQYAVASLSGLTVVALDTPAPSAPLVGGRASSLYWSPDGATLSAVVNDGTSDRLVLVAAK